MRYSKEQLSELVTTWPERTLVIMRGPSGSGKTTLVTEIIRLLNDRGVAYHDILTASADYYFYTEDGDYVFDATKLGEAHWWCYNHAESAMLHQKPYVIVDNTNMALWEMRDYIRRAWLNGYTVRFVEPKFTSVDDCVERNSHGVTVETILAQISRYERIDERLTPAEMARLMLAQKRK